MLLPCGLGGPRGPLSAPLPPAAMLWLDLVIATGTVLLELPLTALQITAMELVGPDRVRNATCIYGFL
jgi:hypothetical protein